MFSLRMMTVRFAFRGVRHVPGPRVETVRAGPLGVRSGEVILLYFTLLYFTILDICAVRKDQAKVGCSRLGVGV